MRLPSQVASRGGVAGQAADEPGGGGRSGLAGGQLIGGLPPSIGGALQEAGDEP